MKYLIKITCHTPPGKAEKSSKSFGMKYLSALDKPIETTIVNDTEFYYVYSYDKDKKRRVLIDKKIPKAERSIRGFYMLIIGLVERGNKLAKKGAWKVEKAKRWIMKQLNKKVKNPKEYEDFIDNIDLSDKKELMDFLSGSLFEYETWELEE